MNKKIINKLYLYFRLKDLEKNWREDREIHFAFKSSTPYTPDLFSSRTAPGSALAAEPRSCVNLFRVDTPGETEPLPRLTSALGTNAPAGGAWLPTLTVCGNWNRKGASPTSGDGLITALRRLPTLIARDARTVAGSQPMPGRAPKAGEPLLWTLGKAIPPEQRRGLKLNHLWAAWYMGWPLTWFKAPSKPSATAKSPSKPPSPGCS
ncbi:hypothetical protein JCM17961_39940 [Endothiovibrio diazotrophicus]